MDDTTRELMNIVGKLIDTIEKQDEDIKQLQRLVAAQAELIQNHDEGIKILMDTLNL